MELKCCSKQDMVANVVRFNCTFMELKSLLLNGGKMSTNGFNCTFMELKCIQRVGEGDLQAF